MTTSPGDPTSAADERAPRPGLRGSAIRGAAWVASHPPEPPLVAAADAAGEHWYRTAP